MQVLRGYPDSTSSFIFQPVQPRKDSLKEGGEVMECFSTISGKELQTVAFGESMRTRRKKQTNSSPKRKGSSTPCLAEIGWIPTATTIRLDGRATKSASLTDRYLWVYSSRATGNNHS